MFSFNLFNILYVNMTIIYILWILIFLLLMSCQAGLTGLACLAALRGTRTADSFLAGSRFLGIGLEVSNDSPGQPAHQTACQQNLDSQQIPRRR